MEEIFARHEKAALMFSGGKDSLSCVYLLKPFWDKITVIWVNTGDAFKETIEIVRKVQSEVPHFFEANSDVLSFKKRFGLPSDLVPIQNSEIGFMATGEKPVKIVSGYDCCNQNIWLPGMAAVRASGATLIIRGQRNDEVAKAPIRSGHVQDGREYLFPIEKWTETDVIEYLKSQNIEIPEHYKFNETSLDCLHCPAFLSKIADRREFVKMRYPDAHNENLKDVAKIIEAIDYELKLMREY